MLTVNQIYKDLIEMIKVALQNNGLSWQVIQSYQQTMGHFQAPFIMLHRLTATNYGFQYGKDKNNEHTENQIEILKFQIEAYKPRNPKDGVNTITAADVVRVIARYFMGDAGLKAVRDKGYNVLRVTEVVEEYYKEVNEIYQVNPHFKLDLVTLQTDTTEAKKISGFDGTIKEISIKQGE